LPFKKKKKLAKALSFFIRHHIHHKKIAKKKSLLKLWVSMRCQFFKEGFKHKKEPFKEKKNAK